MGTRNLTIVYYRGRYCVAQYGQWDGYPEGQGLIVLRFLKGVDVAAFKKRLESVRFLSGDEISQQKWGCGSGGIPHPSLSRDTGAKILAMISNGEVTELENEIEFIRDGPMCEWVYVIDLDRNRFEVYRSGGETPLVIGFDRFYEFQTEENEKNGWYPVRVINTYELDALPTEQEFIDENTVFEHEQ